MVETLVELTDEQADALRHIALREGISEREAIRRALDRALEGEARRDREEIRRRALAAIGSAHADVTDLSRRHDAYFAEAAS